MWITNSIKLIVDYNLVIFKLEKEGERDQKMERLSERWREKKGERDRKFISNI